MFDALQNCKFFQYVDSNIGVNKKRKDSKV